MAAPGCVALKNTEIWQLDAGARLEVHVCVWLNGAEALMLLAGICRVEQWTAVWPRGLCLREHPAGRHLALLGRKRSFGRAAGDLNEVYRSRLSRSVVLLRLRHALHRAPSAIRERLDRVAGLGIELPKHLRQFLVWSG